MMPIEALYSRSSSSSSRVSTPQLTCGQQPGLLEDQLAHGGQVAGHARVAERPQVLASELVDLLGLLAEAEQRLLTALLATGPRHRQHFVRRHRLRIGVGPAGLAKVQ